APEARGVVCVGTPIAGHEVRLAGVESENRVGEIEVRGPAVMDGYYGREAGGPARAGWLATRDLGFLRAGKLYVTGRIKQMLIVCGQNYYPEDIEWTVRALPGVHKGRNVAVLGEPGDGGSSSGAAIAVIAETTVEPAGRAALARRIHDT